MSDQDCVPDSDSAASPLDVPADVPPTDAAPPSEPPRRNFLVQALAAGLGAVVGIIPASIGGLFFLSPLIRKTGAAGDFIPLGLSVDGLPDDGTPQRVTVRADIVNVWNKSPNQPIGSVWLRKIEGQVIAFNTICPHLGCAVDHRPAEGDFYCPCHTSAFDLDGERINDIPPRGMDSLDVDVRDGQVWVKYEEFRGATSEKVPV
ncbi:Rieske 2Fe-2S domain-containing protein [bacterium]|nr:Rieske 2Fe-2S domain-containing protein [bacterium]